MIGTSCSPLNASRVHGRLRSVASPGLQKKKKMTALPTREEASRGSVIGAPEELMIHRPTPETECRRAIGSLARCFSKLHVVRTRAPTSIVQRPGTSVAKGTQRNTIGHARDTRLMARNSSRPSSRVRAHDENTKK